MPDYTPPVQQTGPDAPGVTAPVIDTSALPEKVSTPPAGVEAERKDAPVEQSPADPALLAGKFKSPQDLERAYLELQTKLGQQAKPAPQSPQGEEKVAPPTPKSEGQLDLAAYEAEFGRDGKLSDASYESLGKLGLGRSMVDQYIAGRQAMNDRFVADVTADVGGMEGYTAMVQWAAANLDAPAIVAFNNAIQSADPATAKMAVSGLKARYEAAEGRAPNLLSGQPGGAGGYQSREQWMADIRDPRYQKGDTAFHAMVDRKLRATPSSII
jgi:hypothetical protein